MPGDKEQRLIDDLLKENPEIGTVLEIAEQARISENLKTPTVIVYPTDVKPNPSPERQGSLVIPSGIQRV
jgi:hypothetical protein